MINMNNKKLLFLSLSLLLLLPLLFFGYRIFVPYASPEKSDIITKPYVKKKILILTTMGGGGNLEAGKAIESYLNNDYFVESSFVFKDLLQELDPLKLVTAQDYSAEEIYNLLMPGKYFRVLTLIYELGAWYTQLQKEKIHAILRDYFTKTQPHLIISVIPIVNNIILEVAQELNIPFLLMPTDLDVSPYILNIEKPTYKQFYIGLPFNDEEIIAPLHNAHVLNEHIAIVGSPLRKSFFMKENKKILKKKYAINKDKVVVMVLMGSHGAHEIKDCVQELLKVDAPAHIIACVGKNEASEKELAALSVPPHLSLSIVGFTPHIADYMAMSDVLISKSGTLSVSEALYMNLPLLLDGTSSLLPWEKFNHSFIKHHGFGTTIDNFDEIAPLISAMIKDKSWLNLYKDNIEKWEKKNFPQEIRKLVGRILP
jgi:UDP-N-acetylglucosamine:LPS N-acetylglucosamine transferase